MPKPKPSAPPFSEADALSLLELSEAEVHAFERLAAEEEAAIAAGGVVSDETSADLDALLDAFLDAQYERAQKLDRYGAVWVNAETERDRAAVELAAVKRVASGIHGRVATHDRIVERLKRRLQAFFETRGLEKVEGDWARFRLQTNGGAERVEIVSPTHVTPKGEPAWKVDADGCAYTLDGAEYALGEPDRADPDRADPDRAGTGPNHPGRYAEPLSDGHPPPRRLVVADGEAFGDAERVEFSAGDPRSFVPVDFLRVEVDPAKIAAHLAEIDDGIRADADALVEGLRADGITVTVAKARRDAYVEEQRAARFPLWARYATRGRSVRLY